MTLPPKLEKLIENWPAKVLAFAAALFLYTYHQVSILDTRTLTVPLEVRGVTTMEVTGHVDRYVRVTLRGDSSEINHLGREDFTAYVDLSQIEESGQTHARVHLDLSATATAVENLSIEVSPGDISVSLEKRTARYVPVTPVFVGELPAGYEVSDVSCEPSQIRIAGPEHLVNAVEKLDTDGVFLDNKTGSFTASVAPYTPASGYTWDSAERVEVSVTVTPVIIEKSFNSVPLAVLNSNPDYEIEIQSSRRGEITMTGTQLKLESLNNSPVGLFIDGSVLTEPGEFTVPVVSGVSQNFSVTTYSPTVATVIVRLKDIPEPEEALAEEGEEPAAEVSEKAGAEE